MRHSHAEPAPPKALEVLVAAFALGDPQQLVDPLLADLPDRVADGFPGQNRILVQGLLSGFEWDAVP